MESCQDRLAQSAFGTVVPGGQATIALLDTGVDGSHPDLSGVVVPGISFLDGSDGLRDPNGHGTSLAGIAAAVTDNGIGIAGAAYQGGRLMPVSVLGAAGTGSYSASVTFSALDSANYSPVSGNLALLVAPATQIISFSAPSAETTADPPFALSALSSSGLPARFSALSGPASISGNLVTIIGAGTVVVRAFEPGNNNFNAAPNVDQSFTVTLVVSCANPGALVVPASSTGVVYTSWTASASPGVTYVLEQSLNGGPWSQAYSGSYNAANITVSAKGSYSFRVTATRANFADSAYAASALQLYPGLGRCERLPGFGRERQGRRLLGKLDPRCPGNRLTAVVPRLWSRRPRSCAFSRRLTAAPRLKVQFLTTCRQPAFPGGNGNSSG